MADPRPEGGLRDFMGAGGATAIGDGGLAARVAATLTRARATLPSAAALVSTPAVACVPAGTRTERSLALRAAVALGMSALVICPMAPSGAMASPTPHPAASSQAVAGDASEARNRAHAIMSAFTPLTQRMAEEIHPDILQVMALARKRSGLDFEIVPGTGGKRTLEMQRALVAKGVSKTLISRHTTGLALDIVPTKAIGAVRVPNFFDKSTYYKVDAAMRAAAAELGVPITTGLDFVHFQDLGHFELEKHSYAAYSPGDVAVRTMVASNGALPPRGAFGYGSAMPVPTLSAAPRVTPTCEMASSPPVTTSSLTPGSGTGSQATPGSVTPRSTATVTATRRSPPRGVPDALPGVEVKTSENVQDEPLSRRM